MTAHLAPCGSWRYIALRALRDDGPRIGFLMHNPSTARDQGEEDTTSRRVIGFADRFKASTVALLNPWAGVATKPRDLWAMSDPVGPENLAWIVQACRVIKESGGFWIVAWGSVKPPRARRAEALAHLHAVEALIAATGVPMYALGLNKDGSPSHPLYLPADAPLISWPIGRKQQTPLDMYFDSFGELHARNTKRPKVFCD